MRGGGLYKLRGFKFLTLDKSLVVDTKIVGYRLIDDDNSFVDMPLNSIDVSQYNYLGYLYVKPYNENGVKVLRTPQEKYGIDKGYIIPAGIKLGTQWYKWSRPDFRSLVKRLSEVLSRSMSEILSRPVFGFKNVNIDEEFALYEFWFKLGDEYDFDEIYWEYEDECNSSKSAISNWLRKQNISFVNVKCIFATDDGWFSCTIYFDGVGIWV